MYDEGTNQPVSRPRLAWDTNTAAAAMVLGALLFLVAVRRGFRGVVVGIGS